MTDINTNPDDLRSYLFAEFRAATLRARLAASDLDAIALALKGGFITNFQAVCDTAMTAILIEFPRHRQLVIVVERERNDDGWLVIRGSHGWLHGSATSAFLDVLELASVDSVAIVVRP